MCYIHISRDVVLDSYSQESEINVTVYSWWQPWVVYAKPWPHSVYNPYCYQSASCSWSSQQFNFARVILSVLYNLLPYSLVYQLKTIWQ